MHMGSLPAERAREVVIMSVFIDIELSILYFLLCFIVAYSIVFFLASPETGEAKRLPVWKDTFLQHREPGAASQCRSWQGGEAFCKLMGK